MSYNSTFRAFLDANSSMISSRLIFFVSSLSMLNKARPHNLFYLIEDRRYDRISFSLLNDRSQLAMDTTTISRICKAIRRLGNTFSSPYSTMNIRRSSGRDNLTLIRLYVNILQSINFSI